MSVTLALFLPHIAPPRRRPCAARRSPADPAQLARRSPRSASDSLLFVPHFAPCPTSLNGHREMERPSAHSPFTRRMVDLFLEEQLADTAALLAVLIVMVLAVRILLRPPAEVKPAPAAAAPLRPAIPISPAECAFRPGVTEVEREELMLFGQAHAAGLAPHGGLLALGAAREILAIAPLARERERARLLRRYGETLEWRKRTAADEVLRRGVPPELLAGAQSESWEYGQTRAGLPVFRRCRNRPPRGFGPLARPALARPRAASCHETWLAGHSGLVFHVNRSSSTAQSAGRTQSAQHGGRASRRSSMARSASTGTSAVSRSRGGATPRAPGTGSTST